MSKKKRIILDETFTVYINPFELIKGPDFQKHYVDIQLLEGQPVRKINGTYGMSLDSLENISQYLIQNRLLPPYQRLGDYSYMKMHEQLTNQIQN